MGTSRAILIFLLLAVASVAAGGAFVVDSGGAPGEPPSGPPEVTVLSPNGGEAWVVGNTYRVTWEGSDPDDDPLTFTISLSFDGGTTWTPVAPGITGNGYDLPTAALAPSAAALLKVEATDGTNVAEDISDGSFSLAGKEPGAGVMGMEFPVTLLGAAAAILAALGIRGKGRKKV